ncbi:MAG: hypothetical protein LBQ47_08720 [Endomicrobium sp.]|jgi:predicted transcriptional regulator of viral defense system|nr:hypothetical protein [Endomicrobium sp.]
MKKLTFNNITKQEFAIISRLSYDRKYNGEKIINVAQIKAYLPKNYKYPLQFIYRLKQKKILRPLKRGLYTFNPIETMPVGMKLPDLAVADVYMEGKEYYVGYLSLFNWYGFSEQLFQDVYVINTGRSFEKYIDNIRFNFIKVKKEFMYGIIEKQIAGGKVRITDKERTMIDLLYWNKAVGGINPAIKTVEEIIKEKKCDIQKFIDYAVKYPRPTIRKIIGVILDKAGISETLTNPLYETIKDTSLTSAKWNKRTGTKNNKWKVIINDTSE